MAVGFIYLKRGRLEESFPKGRKCNEKKGKMKRKRDAGTARVHGPSTCRDRHGQRLVAERKCRRWVGRKSHPMVFSVYVAFTTYPKADRVCDEERFCCLPACAPASHQPEPTNQPTCNDRDRPVRDTKKIFIIRKRSDARVNWRWSYTFTATKLPTIAQSPSRRPQNTSCWQKALVRAQALPLVRAPPAS